MKCTNPQCGGYAIKQKTCPYCGAVMAAVDEIPPKKQTELALHTINNKKSKAKKAGCDR